MKPPKPLAITLLLAIAGQSAPGLHAHEFNWETLALGAMKLNGSFDLKANVDGCMQAFRPEVWEKYHANEFEMKKKRIETIEILTARLAKFSLDEEVTLLTRMEFGAYDDTEKGFPIRNLTKNSYWYPASRYARDFNTYHQVSFSNPDLVAIIKMESKRAESFLARRGNGANREVQAMVKFKLTGLKPDSGRGALLAEIQSVTFYEDQQRLKPIAEIVKSQEKVVRKESFIELALKDKIVSHVNKLAITDVSKDGKRWKSFVVELAVGKTYRIEAQSEVLDTYLVLQDDNGKELAHDDDSGSDRNARIDYTAHQTGRHRILVTTYGDGQTTGEFALILREKAK